MATSIETEPVAIAALPATAGRRFSAEAWAARRGVHYGWIIVAVTILVVVTTAGVRAAPGVLILPLEREFGWSRTSIALAISITLLMYGVAAPLSGRLTVTLGLRRMTLLFLTTGGIGVALATTIGSLWQLHVFWGVIVGLGTGGVATVLGATVANTWFDQRRGLVTGLVGGAASAGQLIFLPLLVLVASTWGWRTAVGMMAVLLLCLVLPLAFLLMRARPHDLNLRPYGARDSAATPNHLDERTTPTSHAVRTGDFWLLAGTFFICGFTSMGLIGAHFIPHATEHGFSEAQAAGILSLIGAMNVVGTVTSGWLCDRYPPRTLLASYYFFRAMSLLALPFITTLPLMSVFAVVLGLDYIATVPPTVMLTADRFGRRSVGVIFGWISFSHMVGGAAAAYFAGYIHDIAGEYTIAFYLAGLMGLIAAMMTFGIGARAHVRQALVSAT